MITGSVSNDHTPFPEPKQLSGAVPFQMITPERLRSDSLQDGL